jgi:hypothetical protein
MSGSRFTQVGRRALFARWELVERVRFPVANITKIASADMASATHATTARQLLKPDEIAAPQIGDLFEFRVEVPGVPCPLVCY